MRKLIYSPAVLFVLTMVPRLALADEVPASTPNWAIRYQADASCEAEAATGRRMMAGGGALLGVSYGATASAGVALWSGSPLFLAAHLVPVIGPLAMAIFMFSAIGGEFGAIAAGIGAAYLVDAGSQVAGITLLAVGASKSRRARGTRLSFAPFASGQTAGVAVMGRF
jgi:hypothetical protein